MNRVAAILGFALISVSVFAIALFVPVTGKVRPKTLDNLITAFNCESNARAKSLAYAKKADREGYGKVAGLFRAAAMSEEIELNNHAVVIQAMGGTPRADIKQHKIRSTSTYVQEAETQYVKFYAEALKNLEDWKTGKAEFSVCPICGYPVESKHAFTACPVCATPTKL